MRETTFQRAAKKGGAMLFELVRSLAVVENGEIRCCGVTTAQSVALLALKPHDSVTMGRVGEALGVSAGTATRVIDNLVRDGLVERTENPRDRRSVCVRPTARGRKTIDGLDRCYRRFWQMIFEDIPATRLTGVLDSLELLVRAIARTRTACCGGG